MSVALQDAPPRPSPARGGLLQRLVDALVARVFALGVTPPGEQLTATRKIPDIGKSIVISIAPEVLVAEAIVVVKAGQAAVASMDNICVRRVEARRKLR
jgi:hypothetical protein